MKGEIILKKSIQRIPASKRVTLPVALKHKGYYDKSNSWNSLITLEEYPERIFRDRVEVLIFKGRDQIYLCREKHFFRVPGGSKEKGVSSYNQVYNEAKQEAHLLIKNIRYSGVTYVRLLSKPYTLQQSDIYWDGVRNSVFTAQFDDIYNGNISPYLRDNFMLRTGKFYDVHEVFHSLKPEYRKVISSYQKNIHGNQR